MVTFEPISVLPTLSFGVLTRIWTESHLRVQKECIYNYIYNCSEEKPCLWQVASSLSIHLITYMKDHFSLCIHIHIQPFTHTHTHVHAFPPSHICERTHTHTHVHIHTLRVVIRSGVVVCFVVLWQCCSDLFCGLIRLVHLFIITE